MPGVEIFDLYLEQVRLPSLDWCHSGWKGCSCAVEQNPMHKRAGGVELTFPPLLHGYFSSCLFSAPCTLLLMLCFKYWEAFQRIRTVSPILLSKKGTIVFPQVTIYRLIETPKASATAL